MSELSTEQHKLEAEIDDAKERRERQLKETREHIRRVNALLDRPMVDRRPEVQS